MRDLDVPTPHVTDRVAEAQSLVTSHHDTPALSDGDRELLGKTLQNGRQAIAHLRGAEQLLHGEPHSGNIVNTKSGPLFIDLETCCRGPVEFDLAHVPQVVSSLYPTVNQELLSQCRMLVLAMVATWRWQEGDKLPHGQQAGRGLLDALRQGPPWMPLDMVIRRADAP